MSVRILIVGEAWGAREEAMRHPLVGASGIETALMLAQVHLAPFPLVWCKKCGGEVPFRTPSCPQCKSRIYPTEENMVAHWSRVRTESAIAITNVFNARPKEANEDENTTGSNELGHFFGHERQCPDLIPWKPSKKVGGRWLRLEHYHHIERLLAEVAHHRPNVILALGNAACWALLNQTKISDLRGTFHWSDKTGTKVIPTFHPAAMLRQYPMRPTILADFDKTRRESQWSEIRRTPRWFTWPTPNDAGIVEIESWFATHQTSADAIDIESYAGQISSVGFASGLDHALNIPFHTADHKSFWPTPQLEFRAWKLVRAGIKRPTRKIGQNFIYDLTYFIREGMFPNLDLGLDDTMLWHHARYPEMRKGLGYLASVHCDEVSWKPLGRANELKRDE